MNSLKASRTSRNIIYILRTISVGGNSSLSSPDPGLLKIRHALRNPRSTLCEEPLVLTFFSKLEALRMKSGTFSFHLVLHELLFWRLRREVVAKVEEVKALSDLFNISLSLSAAPSLIVV